MMGGYVADTPAFNGEVDEDEYSGSEEEVVVEKPVAKRTSFVQESTKITTTSSSPSEHTDIRKRLLVSPGSEGNQSSVLFDPDRHTPSPRRSIRTVTSSESYSVRKFVNNGRSGYFTEGFATRTAGDSTKSSTGTSDSSSKKSMLLRFLLKLFIVILIIAVALYFYQINDSESPFKAVEQLARQALEAAVGEEAAVEKDVPHTEPATEPSGPSRDFSTKLE